MHGFHGKYGLFGMETLTMWAENIIKNDCTFVLMIARLNSDDLKKDCVDLGLFGVQ